ncbi:MAG: hypothetical protein HY908_30350 [Myxococcales bacterium]|nr:hypothetical protein [Myxococcales bacterium]
MSTRTAHPSRPAAPRRCPTRLLRTRAVAAALGLAVAVAPLGLGACSKGSRDSTAALGAPLLTDPSDAVKAFEAELGTERKVHLVQILPRSMVLEVQDPANPAHVDSYEFADGELYGPRPVRIVGLEGACSMPYRAIDFAEVPSMLADALRRTTVEAPEGVFARLDPCISEDWTLVVEGPRGSQHFFFDLRGNSFVPGMPRTPGPAAGTARGGRDRTAAGTGAPPASTAPVDKSFAGACPARVAPEQAEERLREAIKLLNQGKSEEVIAAAQRAIASNPSDPRPYVYLAIAYEVLGRLDDKRGAYDACATCADHRDPRYGDCSHFGGRDWARHRPEDAGNAVPPSPAEAPAPTPAPAAATADPPTATPPPPPPPAPKHVPRPATAPRPPAPAPTPKPPPPPAKPTSLYTD